MRRECKEWVRDGNRKGSVESIRPSPSAEGDGWIDLTLRLWGIIPFLNDDQMTEWWQNERHLRIQFFCSVPKSLSFLLIPSFLIILECQGMKMKKGGTSFMRHSIHFHPIPTSFIIQECLRMTGWGWNEGDFWSKAKPLILKSPSFCRHLIIPYQYPFLHVTIPFIWGSFLILISINPLFSHSCIILVSFYTRMIEKWQNDDGMGETIICGLKKKGVLR